MSKIIVLLLLIGLFCTPWIVKQFQKKPVINRSYGQLPLYFIEKKGVGYFVQGKDKSLYFTSKGMVVSLSDPKKDSSKLWNVKAEFVGADPKVKPTGQDPTPAVISYFKGPRSSWKTGLKTYGSLLYRDLWPGIDLAYKGNGIRLEYEFIVHPGADPSQIKLAYSGAEKIHLNEKGQIEVETPLGGFKDERPNTYQEIAGEKKKIDSSFLLADSTYGFKIGPYDKSQTLIIDPATIVYAGFIGGSGEDESREIAIDSSGNAYVTGYTTSTQTTFPVTVGPDLTSNGGAQDAFVAKVNAAGTALTYAGFIGGSGADGGFDIEVDSSGSAYVTGNTTSTQTTFPVTVGPDLTFNGAGTIDAFVAKVNAAGTALTYCGYIGGAGDETGHGITLDSSGNAYVTGNTDSTETSFPVVIGPDLTQNGSTDAFVAKVNATGTALTYCGYIGGSGFDIGEDLAVDSSGNVYVTGNTASTETTFPVTVGPDLTYNGGTGDAFVAKVNSTGSALTYCGYIGGSGDSDYGTGIALDGSGSAYVTGNTDSTQTTFPVSGGPDLTQNGGIDGFIAKVNSTGSALSYAGYIGGSGEDRSMGIAADSSGNAYVTGFTASTETTFPKTGGPDLTYNSGTFDIFVAKISIVATCGDSVVEGSEACDDGNTVNTDACLNTCVAAACGDGVVRTGVEGCDDGNTVATDACNNSCVSTTCGDGTVQTATEQCDNGGSNSDATANACRSNCTNARCGDSVIDTGETCDDGNTTAGDGCDASCLSESTTTGGTTTSDSSTFNATWGCTLFPLHP